MTSPTPDTIAKPGATPLRAVPSLKATAERLGALKELPGVWEGTGFSLIARPHFGGEDPNGLFLQLNWLQESLEIRTIGSPVFNRGSGQGDIAIYGVTYMHRVTDGVTGGALHIEPGMWLNIPATTDPKAEASIARLGTIPHGNAFCTVGFVQHAVYDRIPEIPPANVIPYDIGAQPPAAGAANPFSQYDLSQPSAFRSDPLPPGLTQAMVNDPNQVLRDTLARQVNDEGKTLNWITRLITNTQSAAGIGNIPFITANANTVSLESVFAIESVSEPSGEEFLQLQYSQTALLNYRGKTYPHITVGTLIKAF